MGKQIFGWAALAVMMAYGTAMAGDGNPTRMAPSPGGYVTPSNPAPHVVRTERVHHSNGMVEERTYYSDGSIASSITSNGGGGNGQVVPQVVPQPQDRAPRLGFRAQLHYGQGMEVRWVQPGSLASQIGLEPGDMITAINGQQIRTDSDYFHALRNSGGQITLQIRDVRTSQFVYRTANLDNGVGPVRPYVTAKPIGPRP